MTPDDSGACAPTPEPPNARQSGRTREPCSEVVHDAAGPCEPDYHRAMPGLPDVCRCHYFGVKVVDGDALLAEYIASIPEGTPTLKEAFRASQSADE